jgi:hypothetical protein
VRYGAVLRELSVDARELHQRVARVGAELGQLEDGSATFVSQLETERREGDRAVQFIADHGLQHTYEDAAAAGSGSRSSNCVEDPRAPETSADVGERAGLEPHGFPDEKPGRPT